jgi:Asp-tRNA(Asn)/Glu-tRNA(Gln) amidotransferase A subunit family amidase
VAAGLCPLALGTQTIGSIVRPAAFCGIVGFKPSYDRISREGVIPLAPSYDHVGILAADVETAARAAAVLIPDWRPATPGHRPRLAVPEGPYLERAAGEGLAHFRAVCRRLEEAGYEIEPVPALEDFDAVYERHFQVVAAEIARVHREWFACHGELYERRTAELIRRGQGVSDADRAAGLAESERLRETLTARLDERGLDLWISPPALGAAPPSRAATGDPVMNLPWTQARLPAGRNAAGLPLGLQVVARAGADEELLAWAAEMAGVLAVPATEWEAEL